MLSARPTPGSPVWWSEADWAASGLDDAHQALLEHEALHCPIERELLRCVDVMGAAAWRMIEARGAQRAALAPLIARLDLGRARVLEERGQFQFDDGGRARVVLAVRDRWGALVDLVALSSRDPASWSLRTGAGWLLGAWDFAAAERAVELRRWGAADARPLLRLFGTPLDWLVAGARGCCVLDWGAEALSALRGLGPETTITCDDAAAVERLRVVLAHGGLPEVKVAGSAALRRAA